MPKHEVPVDPDRAEFIRSLRDSGRFYYEALGRFIVEFTDAENELYLFLVQQTGLDIRIANAVISGTKVDSAISFVRRIYAARNSDLPAVVDEILTHLQALNTARNEILHHGTYYDVPVGRFVSNALKSHIPSKVKRWKLTTHLLETMADDAAKAATMLRALIDAAQGEPITRNEALRRAWQYKPQQGPLEIERPKTPQDQPRPRASRFRP
jgi:hypothetical protein